MGERLRVLMSAYACEPGKGSEPEVGWQWALQMARFHDVTVLTRANNRPSIERALAKHAGGGVPQFVYHDRPALVRWKRGARGAWWYYWAWQRSARDIVVRLHRQQHFDLLHHITYASFRFPTAVQLPGVPSIWGPIGGAESAPAALLPWWAPRVTVAELARNAANHWQLSQWGVLGRRARQSTVVLASTRGMQAALARVGCAARLVPAIGLWVPELIVQPAIVPGPLRLLFVGSILALKGVHLALLALRQAGGMAMLTLIGDGPFQPPAQRLAEQLGVAKRVIWRGRLARAETLAAYEGFDALLFPSMHDSGGFAVLEAMANGLPVICLDIGEPGLAITSECGMKIAAGRRATVVTGLAEAIQQYDRDRALLRRHGAAARQRVMDYYDWDHKGKEMDGIYRTAAQ